MDIPIGFYPWEISSMLNEAVVEQHADEAAFLWTMRNRAAREPNYSLKDLAALDERVEAHLEGLAVAGHKGWEYCRANLEHIGPGEIFALGVLAFRSGQRSRMRDALFAACVSPQEQAGLVSALGWLDRDEALPWMNLLRDAKAPEHRLVGIAAHAIHRSNPGPALDAALDDAHPALRARALRAVGELKRGDLIQALQYHLGDEVPECRFWSAWSLSLLGQPDGEAELRAVAETPMSPYAIRALNLVLRVMPLADGRDWVRMLAAQPDLERVAVIATGIIGDPVSVPWLIRRMEVPPLARLAGEAFSLITGADLCLRDLTVDTEDVDQQPNDGNEMDDDWSAYEANLPIPSVPQVTDWWKQNRTRYTTGTRHLCGKPLSREAALNVLAHGNQRQRHAAALAAACFDQAAELFEVRAPGGRQLRQVDQWNS